MSESSTFGGELRRLRQEAGLSLPTLARRIHYSKGYLSKVETGTVRPSESMARLCDVELGTGGVLAAMLPEAGSRRRRTAAAGSTLTALPPVTTHFVGRAKEIAEILTATRDSGTYVTAISGMAGVGKTELAVWCAHRLLPVFADGCLFLDLRGHTPDLGPVSATEALDRFLRLLGVPEDAIPADVDDRSAVYRSRLRGRSMLIVLDNARNARQVLPLLPAEPKCRVLVTSRHRLTALDDAHHVPVETLPAADAVELFGALVADREVNGDNDVLHSVVSRCGWLPLAIRIAAARLAATPAWRLTDLDERLGTEADRLAELDDGERSVAAVFRLSLDNVPPEQRMVFAAVSLHPGADLDAVSAAALCGLAVPATERLLSHVRDAQLIGQRASGRYQFHDLLRGLAVETASAELPAMERSQAVVRLLETDLHAALAADELLAPRRYRPESTRTPNPVLTRTFRDQEAALAWFRAEWPNLVALCRLAAERGYHAHCWQLAFALRSFFFLAKLWDPWIETQRIALPAAEASGDTWAQAMTLNNLGVAMIDRGDLDAAAGYYRKALAGFREIDDQHGVSTSLANYAWVDHYRGEHRLALQNLRVALDFYRVTGAERNVAITLRGMALVETALAGYAQAREYAEQALAIFDELGLDLDAAMTYNCLGWTHFNSGELGQAGAHYREALIRSELCGSEYEAVRAETGLGNVVWSEGRFADAERHWARATRHQVSLNPLMVGEMRARLAAE